jgi:dTDP-4-dehydrorhamnose reductase
MEDSRAVRLVVGAEGLVGRALVRQLRGAGHRVAETVFARESPDDTREFLDLGGPVAAWKCPWPVASGVLCAAITSLEACRLDPVGTARVNVEGVLNLAGKLVARGALVVFLSTNQVFDGTRPQRLSTEPCCPQTEYGRQKAEAEKRLLALGNQVAVVRFTKLVSPELPLFRGWIRALKAGQVIHPFSDMQMAPVPLAFAVRVLQRVVETSLPGIVQVSAPEDITYEQAARHLARRLGVDSQLIQPISASQRGITAASNPLHTTLDTERLRREMNMEPPDVAAALDGLLVS